MRTFVASAIIAFTAAAAIEDTNSAEDTSEFTFTGTDYVAVFSYLVASDENDTWFVSTTAMARTATGNHATGNIIQMWESMEGFSDDGLTYQYHVQNIEVTASGDGTYSKSISCGTETGLTPATGYSNTKGTTTADCTDPW